METPHTLRTLALSPPPCRRTPGVAQRAVLPSACRRRPVHVPPPPPSRLGRPSSVVRPPRATAGQNAPRPPYPISLHIVRRRTTAPVNVRTHTLPRRCRTLRRLERGTRSAVNPARCTEALVGDLYSLRMHLRGGRVSLISGSLELTRRHQATSLGGSSGEREISTHEINYSSRKHRTAISPSTAPNLRRRTRSSQIVVARITWRGGRAQFTHAPR